jgi:diguanylate cyclase (GGDEF)-like protein
MKSARVLGVRLRVAVPTASLLVDAVVVPLVVAGRADLSLLILAAVLTAVSALFARTHQQLTRATDQLIARDYELNRAYTDPVTGLAVRRIAEQSLHDADGTDVTIALVDVDDFRGINNAHGHLGGDEYLRVLAHRLLDAAAGDLVARLGGDEFVVLSIRDPLDLAHVVEDALAATVTVGHTQVQLRASTGISQTRGRDAHLALGEADLAMFTAKRRALGTAFYDPDRDGLPTQPGARPDDRTRDQRSAHRPGTGA